MSSRGFVSRLSPFWSVVVLFGLVTRVLYEWSRIRIPGGARDFFLLRSSYTFSGGACSLQGVPGLFTGGIKRPRSEVSNSMLGSAEVKYEELYLYAPVRLCGLDRDKFIFTFFLKR